jgi:hypothetical protein
MFCCARKHVHVVDAEPIVALGEPAPQSTDSTTAEPSPPLGAHTVFHPDVKSGLVPGTSEAWLDTSRRSVQTFFKDGYECLADDPERARCTSPCALHALTVVCCVGGTEHSTSYTHSLSSVVSVAQNTRPSSP